MSLYRNIAKKRARIKAAAKTAKKKKAKKA